MTWERFGDERYATKGTLLSLSAPLRRLGFETHIRTRRAGKGRVYYYRLGYMCGAKYCSFIVDQTGDGRWCAGEYNIEFDLRTGFTKPVDAYETPELLLAAMVLTSPVWAEMVAYQGARHVPERRGVSY